MGTSPKELFLVYKKILKVNCCELVNKENKSTRFSPKVKEQWRRKEVLNTFLPGCANLCFLLAGMAIDQVEKVLYVADSVSSVILYCVQ